MMMVIIVVTTEARICGDYMVVIPTTATGSDLPMAGLLPHLYISSPLVKEWPFGISVYNTLGSKSTKHMAEFIGSLARMASGIC